MMYWQPRNGMYSQNQPQSAERLALAQSVPEGFITLDLEEVLALSAVHRQAAEQLGAVANNRKPQRPEDAVARINTIEGIFDQDRSYPLWSEDRAVVRGLVLKELRHCGVTESMFPVTVALKPEESPETSLQAAL
jgi:hypothetical protein